MGSVLVHDRWAHSRQGNSVVTAAAQRQRRTKTARQDERENNETNRLDKLGNTSRHSYSRVNDVVGGPRTRLRVVGGEATWAVFTLMRVTLPAV